jgi:hypothetical protein
LLPQARQAFIEDGTKLMMRPFLAAVLLLSMATAARSTPVIVPSPPEDLVAPNNPLHIPATAQTVQHVLANAKCGDWIDLTGEFPPYIKVGDLRPSCPIVIDGSGTTLKNLTFVNSANWILQNGKFGATRYSNVNISNSDHISIRDSTFDHPGSGALAIATSNHIWVSRNHVEGSGGDGFDFAASQFVVISQNVCSNNVRTPIHPDCVQSWDVKGKDLVSDSWITDNDAFGQTQGFDGFDHGDGGFDRIYIVGNRISTTAVWAGQFNACRHCIMANNKAVTLAGQPHGWGGARWFLTDAVDDKTPDSGRSGNIMKNNENGVGL